MGGTVNVKSEVGKGSTFSIIFKAMCKVPSNEIMLPIVKSHHDLVLLKNLTMSRSS